MCVGVSQGFAAEGNMVPSVCLPHVGAGGGGGRAARAPGVVGLDWRPGGWVRAGPGLCLLGQGPLREGAGSPCLGGTAATSLVLCR